MRKKFTDNWGSLSEGFFLSFYDVQYWLKIIASFTRVTVMLQFILCILGYLCTADGFFFKKNIVYNNFAS